MFMNKIDMPQTCPYNFSYKQAIKLIQKLVTQGIVVCHTEFVQYTVE